MNTRTYREAHAAIAARKTARANLPQPKITRIDFEDISIRTGQPTGSAWAIRKWAEGWTAHTPAYDVAGNPSFKDGAPFNIERALAELERAGWTIIRWNTGARAWRGKPEPVRDHASILRLRRNIEARRWNGDLEGVNPNHDLALWY